MSRSSNTHVHRYLYKYTCTNLKHTLSPPQVSISYSSSCLPSNLKKIVYSLLKLWFFYSNKTFFKIISFSHLDVRTVLVELIHFKPLFSNAEKNFTHSQTVTLNCKVKDLLNASTQKLFWPSSRMHQSTNSIRIQIIMSKQGLLMLSWS